MDLKQLTFTPFPKHSVNIITGPTSIGKTYFVTQLLNHHRIYFPSATRIFIVLCNERIGLIDLSPDVTIEVEQIPLEEYSHSLLQPNDVVVIDDVQRITENIRYTISVSAHHSDLASLFVITHSVLGNSNFELLNLSHRVFLFLRSASNSRTTKYIIQTYFPDAESKAYLNTVLNYCQQKQEVLCLELNPIVSQPDSAHYMGFSHLHLIATHGICLLYPMPHIGHNYSKMFKDDVDTTFAASVPLTDLPPQSLVAVPSHVIVRHQEEAKVTPTCSDEAVWNQTMQDIEYNIEGYFKSHKHRQCKNLAKEILLHPKMCVTVDGRFFHLKDRPRTKVSLIDFLALVTRRAAPMEVSRKPFWDIYRLHVQELINNNAPIELFVNKLLLPKQYR